MQQYKYLSSPIQRCSAFKGPACFCGAPIHNVTAHGHSSLRAGARLVRLESYALKLPLQVVLISNLSAFL